MDNHIKSITLYSKENGSDKVYQLQMNPVEGGYGLMYANGKRGSALKPKPKTTTPLSLEAATKEFNKIVNSKKKSKSRYTESADGGETLVLSEKANQDSGIRPQLLNEITEDQANKLCLDPRWVMQPKFDGERRPVVVKNGNSDGTNRYGEFTGGLSASIKAAIDGADKVFDSEDLGAFLAVFDLLEYDGNDLRSLPFIERYKKLTQVLNVNASIRISPLAQTTQEKQAMLQRAIDENQEGVVFKLADAPYTAGRPNSGGTALKYKLYDEASIIVLKQNTKRSIQMGVLDDNQQIIPIGNVTIPANAEIPSVGDIIEVRYLYAYPNGGSLYQPIFEKPRPDLRRSECKQTQLKYKPQLMS